MFFYFESNSTKTYLLNWKKRFKIIEGIAQGLVSPQIFQTKSNSLRLKSKQHLLDEELNPKISDFGMARIFGLKGSEENTNRVVGT